MFVCSADHDPHSEIIACVFPEGVVRLPLFHYAFSIQDLLAHGEVWLSHDGGPVHRFIDTKGLIGKMSQLFAVGRTWHI